MRVNMPDRGVLQGAVSDPYGKEPPASMLTVLGSMTVLDLGSRMPDILASANSIVVRYVVLCVWWTAAGCGSSLERL